MVSKRSRKAKRGARDRERLRRPVGERVQLVAGSRQLLEDRDAALDRTRQHLAPARVVGLDHARAGPGGAAPPPRSRRRSCGRGPAPGSRRRGRPPPGTAPSPRRRRTACDRDGAGSSRSTRRPDRTRSPAAPAPALLPSPSATRAPVDRIGHRRKVWRKSAPASTPCEGDAMTDFDAPEPGLCRCRRGKLRQAGPDARRSASSWSRSAPAAASWSPATIHA